MLGISSNRNFKNILLEKVWHMNVEILRTSIWNSYFPVETGLSITMETAIKISKESPTFIFKYAHTVRWNSRKYWNFGSRFSKIGTGQNWKQKHGWHFASFLHYGFLKLKKLGIFLKKNLNYHKKKKNTTAKSHPRFSNIRAYVPVHITSVQEYWYCLEKRKHYCNICFVLRSCFHDLYIISMYSVLN